MGRRDRPPSARSRLVEASRRRVAVDARALAAFRVAVGLLVFADLLRRSRNLSAFYTDAGVLPRTALPSWSWSLHPSVHALSGEAWVQALLFAVAGGFALALVVGYRTTLATVGSWVLLVSLHNRNPLVLNGGDVLLRLLLFWAVFLPLAARWSVDARRAGSDAADGPPGSSVASAATAALLVQVILVYLVNAAYKLSGDVWLRGDGLEYAFSLGQFTVLLGDVLGGYPTLLTVLDYAWLAMVLGSFLLVVLTGWRRTALVAAFVAAHLGMALTLRLDLFPLISIAALLPFLPPGVWDALEARASGSHPARAADRLLARLDEGLPAVSVADVLPAMAVADVLPAAVPDLAPRLGRLHDRSLDVVPLVFLVLVVLFNFQAAGFERAYGYDPLPDAVEPAVEVTRTDQYWNMFAPDPLSVDGWVVAPGVLENGSRVDAFHGGDVTWDRPPDVSATYPTPRWRKYLVGLWRYDTANRHYFAEYLCRRSTDRLGPALRNVSVYFVEQPTRLDGPEPTERVRLAAEVC